MAHTRAAREENGPAELRVVVVDTCDCSVEAAITDARRALIADSVAVGPRRTAPKEARLMVRVVPERRRKAAMVGSRCRNSRCDLLVQEERVPDDDVTHSAKTF